MQRYAQLTVWKRSHQMVLDVYGLSATFPKSEMFGLTSQLRRSAVSVPANIAEGSKREHGQEYARFINIAEGSLAETEYLLLLSKDLGYASNTEPLHAEVSEIAAMLNALRNRVRA